MSSALKKIFSSAKNTSKNLWKKIRKINKYIEHITKWNISLAEITLFLTTLILIWKFHEPFLLKSINLYDEGVSLLGAQRFMNGETPYKDFFTIYTPLKFTLLGGVFSLFGDTLYTARIFFSLVSLTGFAACYILFWRESNALLASAFTLLLSCIGQFSLTPLFLLLIALWFSAFLKNTEQKTSFLLKIPFLGKWFHKSKQIFLPFIGGALLGLLSLLRIDFGGFSTIVIVLLLIFLTISSPKFTIYDLFHTLGKMGLAFAIIVFPVILIITISGALGEFWNQTIYFPIFGEYQELRKLPWTEAETFQNSADYFTINLLDFSKTFAWFFWPIPFVIAIGFFISRWILNKKRKPPFLSLSSTPIGEGVGGFYDMEEFLKSLLKTLLVGSFVIAALIYASHRSDYGHIIFLNMMAILFLLSLITQFRQKWWGLLLTPLLFIIVLSPAESLFQMRKDILDSEKKNYSFFQTPLPKTNENDALEYVLEFFKKIPQEEKVYVGTSDTSRVFVNNIVLPFLLEQEVATKYHELHTGIVTKAPVQIEMIKELADVNYIVLWDYFICEPNKGCESTNVYILDEYIQENFSIIKKIGNYEILQRKLQ